MNNILGGIEEILNNQISGFHQYILNEPVHLAYVSQNFCSMLGYDNSFLLNETKDIYASLVHPSDRELYREFLHKLMKKEQTLTVQYRIYPRNAEARYVNDTMTSKYIEDGTLVGYSVLTDITPLKAENDNLKFLNETIPCGFLRYTCDKHPKVTYMNEQMLKMIRMPEIKDGEFDYLEMYRENIYLMIPMEERKRFSHFLKKVYTQGAPVAGEMTVLRCDGTKARVYGWVAKSINEYGQEEFQSVCMDITEKYRTEKLNETQRYLKALTEIYNKIFEYDFAGRTVKCIYGENSDVFKWLQNIPMQMEEAMDKWIQSSVFDEDKELVESFFRAYFRQEVRDLDAKPPQIRYRALSSDGSVKTYTGIFLKIDSTISLFCCKNTTEDPQEDSLRNENLSLRNMNENMQELIMRFTEGIVAFEVEDGQVKPLYVSDNVCEFFGYSKEEWIQLAGQSHSIKKFVAKSGIGYEVFMDLFENGEAEFEYIDVNTRMPHRIRAVCSNMFSEGAAKQYVMLYHMNADSGKGASSKATNGTRIHIRTFGYFDVFVDDKPIAFRNEKSKELFALLVDRRGGYVSSEEAISFLWEDEPVNSITLARYRKVALRLKNMLEEYGISDVVESVNGRRRIVTDKVQCDLYDYLSHKEEYAQLFKGSYLTNYSWGENTLGELISEHNM